MRGPGLFLLDVAGIWGVWARTLPALATDPWVPLPLRLGVLVLTAASRVPRSLRFWMLIEMRSGCYYALLASSAVGVGDDLAFLEELCGGEEESGPVLGELAYELCEDLSLCEVVYALRLLPVAVGVGADDSGGSPFYAGLS